MSIESVQAQKRWREKHREKYNEQQRKFALNYYYNNREAELGKKKHVSHTNHLHVHIQFDHIFPFFSIPQKPTAILPTSSELLSIRIHPRYVYLGG